MSAILIISPEPWKGHFVSKHHYAVNLAARGYGVYFLNPPDASLSGVRIEKTNHANLWEVSGPMVAKGLRFYPAAVRRRLEARWLRALEKKAGRRFSAIWLFENSRFFDMKFAKNRLKIYHQVDLNQDFHVVDAASSADICLANTDAILRKILPYSDRTYKIHHGVSMPSALLPLSEEQKGRFFENGINAVYVGNLEIPYLDTKLLGELVKAFPAIRFHFIGKYSEDGSLYKQCKDSENIRWWGAVKSEMIPSILLYCDIQLLTYKVESDWEKEQMASPHKLMEYLSSGKVVVATYTDEYKDKPGLLEMVDRPGKYIEKFYDVVSNIDDYNSNTKQTVRRAFAQENTYPKQLDRIITILNKHNLKF
ncbi:glycosyltransferase [Sulfurimonas sp. HSL1-2]|uniref:glycosyltransferase n=1 Tax=Thiomicrolovo zhangzhouensis TaxID=3131933 RepID=UPI0031FA0786